LGFDCEVVFEDASRDLALLRVRDDQASAWPAAAIGQLVVLAEPGSRAMPVEAVGFPDAALDEQRRPNPELIKGQLLPAGGAVSGRMPLDVDSSVPETSSAWRGMSGAAVRDTSERLLGVIIEVDQERQRRRMYAAVLPDPAQDARFFAALKSVGIEYPIVEAANAPQVRQLLSVFDPAGRPYRVRDVPSLDVLGTRKARTDIDLQGDPYYPYVRREVDVELDSALDACASGGDRRMLLLVGDAMAGKSRCLAEAVRRHPVVSAWPMLRPRVDTDLEQVAVLARDGGGVMWLDDLDRYLPRVDGGQLHRILARPRFIVVATIRAERLISQDIQNVPSSWDLVTDDSLVKRIELPGSLTTSEQAPLRDHEPMLRDAVARSMPLGEVLAAAAEMARKLRIAGDLYRGLAYLIADWSRTGNPAHLPESEAIRLWDSYLSQPRATWLANLPTEETTNEYEKVRSWLAEPVAGSTTALVRCDQTGLVSDGYLQQQRSFEDAAIPLDVWAAALGAAARSSDTANVMLTIGHQAALAGVRSVIWEPGLLGSQSVHKESTRKLGFSRRAERLVLNVADTVSAGTTVEGFVVGRIFSDCHVQSVQVLLVNTVTCEYEEQSYDLVTDEEGNTQYETRYSTETEHTRVTVDSWEFHIDSIMEAGSAFVHQFYLTIPRDCIGTIRTKNVQVGWEIIARLQGERCRSSVSVPIRVAEAPKLRDYGIGPTEITVSNRLGVLSFDNLPSFVTMGRRFEGSFLLEPKKDFSISGYGVSVDLGRTSTVHRSGGRKERRNWDGVAELKTRRFEKGHPVRITFSVDAPDAEAGPSFRHPLFSIDWHVRVWISRKFPWILSGFGTGRQITMCTASPGTELIRTEMFQPRPRKIRSGARSISFNPDGRLLTTRSITEVEVFDLKSDRHLWRQAVKYSSSHVQEVAFSPDGTKVATGTARTVGQVLDSVTGQLVLELAHGGPVVGVAFSSDGARLATGSEDGIVRVWDAVSGQLVLELAHGGPVVGVAFSSDGARLATGSEDGIVRVWDAVTGKLLQVEYAAYRVVRLAFSPDGTRLAAATGKAISIWDATPSLPGMVSD
jgi:WD40 repeat protein